MDKHSVKLKHKKLRNGDTNYQNLGNLNFPHFFVFCLPVNLQFPALFDKKGSIEFPALFSCLFVNLQFAALFDK